MKKPKYWVTRIWIIECEDYKLNKDYYFEDEAKIQCEKYNRWEEEKSNSK